MSSVAAQSTWFINSSVPTPGVLERWDDFDHAPLETSPGIFSLGYPSDGGDPWVQEITERFTIWPSSPSRGAYQYYPVFWASGVWNGTVLTVDTQMAGAVEAQIQQTSENGWVCLTGLVSVSTSTSQLLSGGITVTWGNYDDRDYELIVRDENLYPSGELLRIPSSPLEPGDVVRLEIHRVNGSLNNPLIKCFRNGVLVAIVYARTNYNASRFIGWGIGSSYGVPPAIYEEIRIYSFDT